jgi:cytochrome c553
MTITRTITRLAGAALALLAAAVPATADPAAGRAKAQMCQVCHGFDGLGKNPDVPNIAGDSQNYLVRQLKAFRSGERQHEQMSIIAQSLSDEDIQNLSAYYAAITVTATPPTL